MTIDVNDLSPGDDLVKALRARLALDGSSLARWSIEIGLKRQNLMKALTGEWKGPKATRIVERALRYVGSLQG